MGDRNRFKEFTHLIISHFPNRHTRIADVAGGKGMLQAALRQAGYRNIVTIDKRPKLAHPDRQDRCRYKLFNCNEFNGEFDLVLGMHPDGATDHIIEYSRINSVDFMVCPCCVIPSASPYGGNPSNYNSWIRHLRKLASNAATYNYESVLSISGRSRVLIGKNHR